MRPKERNISIKKMSEITELFKCDIHTLPCGLIISDEIICVVQSLKFRKALGYDLITNEHIKYGGETLTLCIAMLFNAIIDSGKIPTEWKQGLIIPIYKGAGKPKDSCKSYRPVALLPCIFKIFEKIILSRINSEILQHSKFPNPQQQGFQKHLGCLTASFDLQETVFHNLEQNNNVYVSFLDTSNAFDTVWRNGLLYKLFNLGITGKTWSLIQNCLFCHRSIFYVEVKRPAFYILYSANIAGIIRKIYHTLHFHTHLPKISNEVLNK